MSQMDHGFRASRAGPIFEQDDDFQLHSLSACLGVQLRPGGPLGIRDGQHQFVELPGALQWALAGGAHDAFVVQFNVALARKLSTASRACVREKRRRRTAVDNPPPAEIALRDPRNCLNEWGHF